MTSHEWEAIANASELHGFIWSIEPVSRADGNTKVELGKGPILIVTDPTSFEVQFPGVILGSLDSSSIRVKAQSVVRRMLLKDRRASVEDMEVAVVQAVAGIRSTVRGGGKPTISIPAEAWENTPEIIRSNVLAKNKVMLMYEDETEQVEAEE